MTPNIKNVIALVLSAASLSAAAQSTTTSAATDTDSVSYTLGEIVVRANPRVTSLRGDAMLTRVTGTPLEHAGTANEVLTQIPMVLGSDGNFEVFGNFGYPSSKAQ